jgi:transposase
MGRPPALPVEEKLRIVLAVLAAKTTIVQAAREHQVSETSVCNWRRQFVEAGRAGLAEGVTSFNAEREVQLKAENDALKVALRDASVQVRVWQMSAESRLGPSRTSR